MLGVFSIKYNVIRKTKYKRHGNYNEFKLERRNKDVVNYMSELNYVKVITCFLS